MRDEIRVINKRLKELYKLIDDFNEKIQIFYETGDYKLRPEAFKKFKEYGNTVFTESHYLIDLKTKLRAEYCRKKTKEYYYKKKGNK